MPENYHTRIMDRFDLISRNKLLYQSKATILSPDSYEASEYPSKIISETTTHREYIVVVDISQEGDIFSEHLARTEQLINELFSSRYNNNYTLYV